VYSQEEFGSAGTPAASHLGSAAMGADAPAVTRRAIIARSQPAFAQGIVEGIGVVDRNLHLHLHHQGAVAGAANLALIAAIAVKTAQAGVTCQHQIAMCVPELSIQAPRLRLVEQYPHHPHLHRPRLHLRRPLRRRPRRLPHRHRLHLLVRWLTDMAC